MPFLAPLVPFIPLIAAGVGVAGTVYASGQAQDTAQQAAQTAAGGQQQQLDYLKQINAVPQAQKEGALQQLGMFYGTGAGAQAQPQAGGAVPGGIGGGIIGQAGTALGGTGGFQDAIQGALSGDGDFRGPTEIPLGMDGGAPGGVFSGIAGAPVLGGDGPGAMTGQGAFVEEVKQSPFYQMMIEAGREGVAATQAATGGLRSGGAIEAFKGSDEQVLMNLVNQRLGGLAGLAGIGTGEQQIGQTMADIGMTQAQGIKAGGQAYQQGLQGIGNILSSGISNTDWNKIFPPTI